MPLLVHHYEFQGLAQAQLQQPEKLDRDDLAMKVGAVGLAQELQQPGLVLVKLREYLAA